MIWYFYTPISYFQSFQFKKKSINANAWTVLPLKTRCWTTCSQHDFNSPLLRHLMNIRGYLEYYFNWWLDNCRTLWEQLIYLHLLNYYEDYTHGCQWKFADLTDNEIKGILSDRVSINTRIVIKATQKQEARGSHCSPEKTVQINKHIWLS